jgi:hypothetical protein
MGRRPDAARLFQEVVAEYASSTAATEAQQRLDELRKAP